MFISVLAASMLLGSCSTDEAQEKTAGTSTAVTEDSSPVSTFTAQGGEPRTGGYWLSWSSCGAEGGDQTALLDDLLAVPGIDLGNYAVSGCEEAARLISVERDGQTPVLVLAGELLVAEANINTGAALCPTADQATRAAQTLLASIAFDGTEPAGLGEDIKVTATELTAILLDYNLGELCR